MPLARGLLNGAGMRTFTFISIALVAACGGGHDAPGPDSNVTARCGGPPRQLVTKAELAPASLGTVAVANPFLAADATGLYYNLDYTGANGNADPAGHLVYLPFDGAPQVLADGVHAGRFVLDGDGVIYTDSTGIHRVARAGGAPTTLVTLPAAAAWLASDGQDLYYGTDSGVSRVPLAGGAPQQVASLVGFSGSVVGGDPVVADFSGGNVVQITAQTGATTMLATGQMGPLYPQACGPGATCWIDAGQASPGNGTLMRLGPDQATPEGFSNDPALFHPHGLAFDGTSFFVTSDYATGTLSRVDAASGHVDILENTHGDGDVAVDDQCVYYSDFDGIFAVAKNVHGHGQ